MCFDARAGGIRVVLAALLEATAVDPHVLQACSSIHGELADCTVVDGCHSCRMVTSNNGRRLDDRCNR